ncbi:hypothetical protein F0562_019666 [Nyssa sinensis]|uniref:Uncharacterized protein n=1 Tax=Nyssa sinensis TaxID=561372 RepID=A0A5J5BPY7_9ASTE|nr:hypothetical protein F0562_019666 [Nyssa sinensis]
MTNPATQLGPSSNLEHSAGAEMCVFKGRSEGEDQFALFCSASGSASPASGAIVFLADLASVRLAAVFLGVCNGALTPFS